MDDEKEASLNESQATRWHLAIPIVLGGVMLGLLLYIALPVHAQAPDVLELYDANEDGVIDGDELIRAAKDHFAGVIDRTTLRAVAEGYARVWNPAVPEAAGDSGCTSEYVNSVIAAHKAGNATIDQVYAAIHCFLNSGDGGDTEDDDGDDDGDDGGDGGDDDEDTPTTETSTVTVTPIVVQVRNTPDPRRPPSIKKPTPGPVPTATPLGYQKDFVLAVRRESIDDPVLDREITAAINRLNNQLPKVGKDQKVKLVICEVPCPVDDAGNSINTDGFTVTIKLTDDSAKCPTSVACYIPLHADPNYELGPDKPLGNANIYIEKSPTGADKDGSTQYWRWTDDLTDEIENKRDPCSGAELYTHSCNDRYYRAYGPVLIHELLHGLGLEDLYPLIKKDPRVDRVNSVMNRGGRAFSLYDESQIEFVYNKRNPS